MNFMVSDDELKASILHRLAKKRKWGESHTAFENVAKGVPSHLRGKLKDLAEELIKEGLSRWQKNRDKFWHQKDAKGFIIKKPTSYGLQISLSVERSEEIKWRIKKYFDLVL